MLPPTGQSDFDNHSDHPSQKTAVFSMGTGDAVGSVSANALPYLASTGAWHAPVIAPMEEQSNDSSAARHAGQDIPAVPAPVLPR